MKKYLSLLLLLSILLTSVGSVRAEQTSSIDDTYIRVGLKSLYEMVDQIVIGNISLTMGYNYNGVWTPEYIFNSTTGFTIKPATGYYLISTSYYLTYSECDTVASGLRAQGYVASAGTVSPGIWKVYIGSYGTDAEVTAAFAALEGVMDLHYEKVADNNLRTKMEYSEGAPVLMENSTSTIQFMTSDITGTSNILKLSQRSYRGRLEIGRYNKKGVTAINVITIREYLYGVVPSEMPSKWPLEAIKAQSVAARNYVVYYTTVSPKYPKEPYSICDTVLSQAYIGYTNEAASCTQAVNETSGMLVYYDNKVVPAYYFSTSGGHTEDSQNVWSGTVGYLKGRPDIYETQPEKTPWVLSKTSEEVKTILAKYQVNIGDILDMTVTGYTSSGRALGLKIIGTTGEYEVIKETMRTWFGLSSRKFTLMTEGDTPQTAFNVQSGAGVTQTISTNLAYVINGNGTVSQLSLNSAQINVFSAENFYGVPTLSGQKNVFIFVGQGSGHGVGMSQSGAKGMAQAGYTYEEILEYYYSGADVR